MSAPTLRRALRASHAGDLRVVVLQHERETGLGAFAPLLEEAAVDYDVVHTLDGPLPPAGAFDGAIALGGSLSAHDERLVTERRWIRDAVLAGVPFLGICLGAQLLAAGLGARVERQARPEIGVHDVYLTPAAGQDPLFAGFPARLRVAGWHGDRFSLPRGAVLLAGSAHAYQAFRLETAAYGLQFHPELRADAVAEWARLPGYSEQLEAVGASAADVADELARATPELGALARHLHSGWLALAARLSAAKRRLGIAV